MMLRMPSQREKEILQEIAQGYSEKEISSRLLISEATVQSHKRNLFVKLNAINSPSLVYKAICMGILPVELEKKAS